MLLGVISQFGRSSWTFQERPSSPLQFGQEENIPGHSIESRAYWFILKIARMFPILTSRNRMNTFIIVNINPTCKRCTWSICFSIQKRPSLFPSVWPGTECTWALICEKSLLICFESYQGIPYSHTGRVERNVNTLLMVNINPICKR